MHQRLQIDMDVFPFFSEGGYIYRYPVQYIAIHAGMMMMMDAKFYFF